MSRPGERAERRRRFHADRCSRRSGRHQLYAAWWWLMAELADADRITAGEITTEVAEHLMGKARALNGRKGARRDDAA